MRGQVCLGVPLLVGALACDGTIKEPDGPDVPAVCDGFSPGPNLARRLTVPEYVATVRATFGVDVADEAVALLPADLRADGFTNTAGALIVTLDHVEAYAELAEIIVERVGDPASLAGCTDYTEACQRDAIEALGLRAFRRLLTAAEVDALSTVFDAAAEDGEEFGVAVGLLVEVLAQSPPFLYRIENERNTTIRALDAYELASRLSYFVWGAPPDDALFDAAATGALRTDAQIEAHVRRMLDDPRARTTSMRYVSDWLHLSRLDALTRSAEKYPEWDLTLAADMKAETLAFFEQIAWEQDRPLRELFNAQFTHASERLAEHYGLPGVTPGDATYDLSGVVERGGLLTQGSLLTIGGDDSSMVGRGLFLLETLLCGELSSPPPGVDTTPPETMPGSSQRTYSEQRVDNPSCGGCHGQMEPIAWGLERFDATGAYRLEDEFGNGLREDGQVLLDPAGEPVPYATASELMDVLAASDRVRACMTEKATQYAMGRILGVDDECALAEIDERFAASSGTYRDLMVAIALSPTFRLIGGE